MRTVKLAVLALLGTCVGCGFATGHIPATATPERTARYLRTQDAANVAAGAGLDLLLRNACHGPTQQLAVEQVPDSTPVGYHYRAYRRWFTGAQCPVLRVSTVLAVGGIYRATSPDYRESGWLMNVYGAVATELVHLIVDAFTKHWGDPRR